MLRIPIFVLLFALTLAMASAAAVTDLYHAVAYVTGTEEPERTRGFRSALTDVVIKVTGDHRLAGSGLLKPLLARPHGFVERFEYEDRMKGIPVHDEQGTRERPHFLRVQFSAAKVDQALHELGLKKWSADRPVLAIWLGVHTALEKYVLSANGDRGYGQRAVFEETARRQGIPIVLPRQLESSITFGDIASQNLDKLAAASGDADAVLLGTLILGGSGRWDIQRVLRQQGRSSSWGTQGVSFDSAIKDGLQHSALILSNRIRD